MTDPLLNPTEAATYLGLAVHTLRVWRTRGEGPTYIKVGAAVRYRRTDLDAWLDSRTVRPSR